MDELLYILGHIISSILRTKKWNIHLNQRRRKLKKMVLALVVGLSLFFLHCICADEILAEQIRTEDMKTPTNKR